MDAARARTLFRMPGNEAIASLFTVTVCCKFILLILEATEKRNLHHSAHSPVPPEQAAGILNRSFFWWFNPLLLTGYKQTLKVDELFTLDDDIALETWEDRVRKRWNKCEYRLDKMLSFC